MTPMREGATVPFLCSVSKLELGIHFPLAVAPHPHPSQGMKPLPWPPSVFCDGIQSVFFFPTVPTHVPVDRCYYPPFMKGTLRLTDMRSFVQDHSQGLCLPEPRGMVLNLHRDTSGVPQAGRRAAWRRAPGRRPDGG